MNLFKLAAFFIALLPTQLLSASYPITKLTHVYTDKHGKIAIKWDGSPNPGPCGANHGWAVLEPTADRALKTFIFTLYVSEKAATISTSGCDGNNEIVNGIYSPGG